MGQRSDTGQSGRGISAIILTETLTRPLCGVSPSTIYPHKTAPCNVEKNCSFYSLILQFDVTGSVYVCYTFVKCTRLQFCLLTAINYIDFYNFLKIRDNYDGM